MPAPSQTKTDSYTIDGGSKFQRGGGEPLVLYESGGGGGGGACPRPSAPPPPLSSAYVHPYNNVQIARVDY